MLLHPRAAFVMGHSSRQSPTNADDHSRNRAVALLDSAHRPTSDRHSSPEVHSAHSQRSNQNTNDNRIHNKRFSCFRTSKLLFIVAPATHQSISMLIYWQPMLYWRCLWAVNECLPALALTNTYTHAPSQSLRERHEWRLLSGTHTRAVWRVSECTKRERRESEREECIQLVVGDQKQFCEDDNHRWRKMRGWLISRNGSVTVDVSFLLTCPPDGYAWRWCWRLFGEFRWISRWYWPFTAMTQMGMCDGRVLYTKISGWATQQKQKSKEIFVERFETNATESNKRWNLAHMQNLTLDDDDDEMILFRLVSLLKIMHTTIGISVVT